MESSFPAGEQQGFLSLLACNSVIFFSWHAKGSFSLLVFHWVFFPCWWFTGSSSFPAGKFRLKIDQRLGKRCQKLIFKLWRPSWIFDQLNFSYFASTSRPMLLIVSTQLDHKCVQPEPRNGSACRCTTID